MGGVSPAETKPEPDPSVVAARDSERSDCQGVGRNAAGTEQRAWARGSLVALELQLRAHGPSVLHLQRDCG